MVDRSPTPHLPFPPSFVRPIEQWAQIISYAKRVVCAAAAAAAGSILTHSGQGISTGNAIFYFRADFDELFFFWGSQSCHRSVCLSVVVVFFRLFCQLSAAMNLII